MVGCKVLPGLGVDVKCFHASPADIFVAQLWAAFGSLSRCQLSIENVFWDVAILHAVDMPQPTQPVLPEQGEHAWMVGSGQDLDAGLCVLPKHAQDTVDASRVEGLGSFLLSGICGPCLAAVHSVLATQALYTTILVFTVSLGLVHTREVMRRASIVAAVPILLSISVSQERLSVMVEPRYVTVQQNRAHSHRW